MPLPILRVPTEDWFLFIFKLRLCVDVMIMLPFKILVPLMLIVLPDSLTIILPTASLRKVPSSNKFAVKVTLSFDVLPPSIIIFPSNW